MLIPVTQINAASGMTLIQEQILGADGAIDFQNIPASYRHLRVELIGKSSVASVVDVLFARFNADAGGSSYFYSNNGVKGGPGAEMQIGPFTGNTVGATEASVAVIDIPYYTSLAFRKSLTAMIAGRINSGGTSADMGVSAGYGAWISAVAAVTRFQVNCTGNNLLAGTKAALYGVT